MKPNDSLAAHLERRYYIELGPNDSLRIGDQLRHRVHGRWHIIYMERSRPTHTGYRYRRPRQNEQL